MWLATGRGLGEFGGIRPPTPLHDRRVPATMRWGARGLSGQADLCGTQAGSDAGSAIAVAAGGNGVQIPHRWTTWSEGRGSVLSLSLLPPVGCPDGALARARMFAEQNCVGGHEWRPEQ